MGITAASPYAPQCPCAIGLLQVSDRKKRRPPKKVRRVKNVCFTTAFLFCRWADALHPKRYSLTFLLSRYYLIFKFPPLVIL